MSMFSAIYKGMTGLLGFSKSLDTLSNNVSNLNTPGYKGRDVFFRELGSDYDGAGSNRNSILEAGIGQGVQVAGSYTRFAQGDIRETGSETDLAIDGTGFFILRGNGRVGNDIEWYTRNGQFRIDDDGYLVEPATGYRVAGFSGGRLEDIRLDLAANSPAVATTEVGVRASLAANATTGTRVPPAPDADPNTQDQHVTVDVIDESGQVTVVELVFVKQSSSSWRVDFLDQFGANLANSHVIEYNGLGVPLLDTQTYSLSFETFEYINEDAVDEHLALLSPVTITGGDLTTANAVDLSLTDAQLIVRDDQTIFYGESGGYFFNAEGYLLNAAGQRVAARTDDGILVDVDITDDITMASRPTSEVFFNGVLNADAAIGEQYPADIADAIPFDIVDDDGVTRTLSMAFEKVADNEWEVILVDEDGNTEAQTEHVRFVSISGLSENPLLSTSQQIDASFTFGSVEVEFVIDFTGNGAGPALVERVAGTPDINFLSADGFEEGVVTEITLTPEGAFRYQYSNGQTAAGPQLAVVERSGRAVNNVQFDFSQTRITDTVTTSQLSIEESNGVTNGQLLSFTFSNNGEINLSFSNGQQRSAGQIALAHIINDKNLVAVGDTLFRVREGTDVRYGNPEQGAFGTLRGRSIELSNVELSREFAEIIIVQRGFQASSQVLNVSNEIIEELYNSVRGR